WQQERLKLFSRFRSHLESPAEASHLSEHLSAIPVLLPVGIACQFEQRCGIRRVLTNSSDERAQSFNLRCPPLRFPRAWSPGEHGEPDQAKEKDSDNQHRVSHIC